MRFVLFASSLAVAGCYCSHERAPLETDAGAGADAGAADAGTDGARDDAPTVDARTDAPRSDAPRPDGRCVDEIGVGVYVDPVTSEPGFCDGYHFEGVMILGVDPEPDDSIRIHADFCPARGADCRCDVVVTNVGADLAGLVLLPREGNTVDLGPTSVLITTTPTCECLGCPCSYALGFYAGSGILVPPPHATSELVLSAGEEMCVSSADCASAAWRLHGSSLGIETDVPAGEDRDLGVLHLRSLRDVDLFAPCAACATCGSPQGAWAAWVRH